MFQKVFMIFKGIQALFPVTAWLYVYGGIGFAYQSGIKPGFIDGDFYLDVMWLLSPMIAWFVVALLDMLELFEADKKGGRLNLILGWILLGASWLAGYQDPSSPFYVMAIPHDSSAWAIGLGANVLTVIYVFLSSRINPGKIREFIDREINLVKYGTTWKPAQIKDHGSASLGDVKAAARHYHNGDIIFGIARQHRPEADSALASFVRSFVNVGLIITIVARSLLTKPKMAKTRFGEIQQNIRVLSNDPKKAPMLSGDFNGHLLVVSGSGGGKTVTFVIPNMLHYKAGSVVCIDPKGEVHAVTGRARRQEYGHSVYKLKPGDAGTDTFNVIGWLDPNSASFTKDCTSVAAWIFPESGEGGDGASYYTDTARRLFGFALTYFIAEWNRKKKGGVETKFPTLVDIYKFFYRSPDEVQTSILEIYNDVKDLDETSNRYGVSTLEIKTWAGSFVGGDMERTWPNTVSSVQKEIGWLGSKSLSSIVSGEPSEDGKGKLFHAQEILNGKTSIYICIDLAVLQSTPALPRLVVGAFLNAIFQSEGAQLGRTLFMIDEMQVLGKFPILHDTGLNQGRGYGVTLAGIIQAPEALDKQAGKGTYTSWVDNTMLQQYFAIGGEETAEKISKQIGETTVETSSYSGGRQKQRGQVLGADNSGGVNISTQRHSRRLKTATEVMGLDRSYAVVFRRVGVSDPRVDKKPMIVGTCFYEARPELMALADKNPYARSDVNNAVIVPDGCISDLVFEDIAQMKSRAASDRGEDDIQFSTMDEYIDGDWGEMDVEKTIREEAKNNPQMQRLLDALDRYYDETQEATEEDIELLKMNDIISVEEHAKTFTMADMSNLGETLKKEATIEDARLRNLTSDNFPDLEKTDPSFAAKLSTNIRQNRNILDTLEKELTASMAVRISNDNSDYGLSDNADRRDLLNKLEKLKG